jgi:hypothetical protein
MNEVRPIQHNALVSAIAAVMANVHRLGKDETNDFAKYKFTSVDEYKDHLRPLLAANGLAIRMGETGFERFEALNSKGGKTLMCRFTFAIALMHESGAEEPPETTTVMLPYAAAQTTGQARSYALKEWLKAKFLASSGDISEDVDSQPQGEYRTTLPKKDARPLYTKLEKSLDEIERTGTVASLEAWQKSHKGEIESLPDDWLAPLRQRYATVLHALKTRQPLSNGSDKQPVAPRDPAHKATFDMQAPPAHDAETGEVIENGAPTGDTFANYDQWVSDQEAALKAASDDEQDAIWNDTIAPRIEAGQIFPPDADRLKRLLRNT